MSTVLAAAGTRERASVLGNAGVDRIIAYHSSAYRERGLPSVAGLLPWASANEQTLAMLPGVLDGAGATPVLATVCANDGLIPRSEMIDRLRDAGAVGVLNAPTVGLLDGTVRLVLEAEGLGRDAEIALLAEAVDAGLEAWAYVFDPAWTRLAIEEGATGVIIHLGITGYPSSTSVEACLQVAADLGARHVVLHGGTLTTPAELRWVLDSIPEPVRVVNGYMGASVFERTDDTAAAVRAWRDVLPGGGAGQGVDDDRR
ncbi:MAG: phosphoenolpyruvate hydrolase family protein [Propionicimonas sp.]|nr:phosphoenolpyruvate hydrolase family protein [Propionicimonas sp.]